jgi:HEAT repeat protein
MAQQSAPVHHPVTAVTLSAAASNALAADLLSPNPDVQTAALNKLGKLDTLSKKQLVPRLVKELDNPDFDHYYGAILALAKMGPAALPALIQVMQGGGSAPRRRYAAMAIGKMSKAGAPAVPAFVNGLSDKDRNFRLIVMDELPNLGPAAKAGVPALIAATKDENIFVRLAAIKALGEIGPGAKAAIPFLMDDLKAGVYGADEALGGIGSAAVPTLLAAYKSLRNPNSGCDNEAVKKLRDLRDGITRALGNMGAQAAPAVPELIAALKDNLTRDGAIAALSGIGPAAKDAVPALIAILQGSPEYSYAAPTGCEYTLDVNTAKAGKPDFAEQMMRIWTLGLAEGALKKIGTPEALAAVQDYDAHHPKQQ